MSNDPHSRPDGGTYWVDISLIRVNHKKLRKLSQAKIARYLSDYDRGDDFPPIVVEDCGAFYTVRDGRHRFQAQQQAGFRQIAVSLYN
ncbi:MAG TPA: ParB N-terminal domain-containing protein [Candidatus Saccharimonas sp.]|nr:ParB N-terminal domain-containing protein [Candidatus Saccharimonas sp.]